MASGYVYRKDLLDRIKSSLAQGPVVLWGPPGFGKTLLLKEVSREMDLALASEWREQAGVFDLTKPPPEWRPGQLLAMRRKPQAEAQVSLFGPRQLAFSQEEAQQMARHLRVGRGWRKTWRLLGGWPLLLRQAYESGAAAPHEEPLRSWLQAFLRRLTPGQLLAANLLRLSPSELAAAKVLNIEDLETLLARGLVHPLGGRLRLLAALVNFLDETSELPPFAEAKRLLKYERDHGDVETALQGYLRYRSEEALGAFIKAAKRWNSEGETAKTIEYGNELLSQHESARAALLIAEAESLRGQLERSLEMYQQLLQEVKKGELRAKTLLGMGTVLVRLGRYEEAVEVLDKADECALPADRPLLAASLGGALIRTGDFAGAARVLQRVQGGEIDTQVEARARHNLGIALHHMGRINEAIVAYQTALPLRRQGSPLAQANTLLSLGEALRLAGRWEEAHEVLLQAREVAESSGEYRALGYSYLNIADLYLDAGWLEKANALYMRAYKMLEPSQDGYGLGLIEHGLGRMYARSGRTQEAAWRYKLALQRLSEGGSPAEVAQVLIAQARLAQPQQALSLLRRAGESAQEVGARLIALQANLSEIALRLPQASPEEVEGAAQELAQLAALPLLLGAEYMPVWFAAAAAGEAGRLAFERLAHGWGTVRFYTLGAARILRDEPLEFFTKKEPWVLYKLWLNGATSAAKLGEELYGEAKNPRKRAQIAVHHVRETLGDDWIGFSEGAYRAAPLPGSWWDAAVLRSLYENRQRLPEWAVKDASRAAATLYRGDFLAGAPFARERQELREAFAQLS